MQFVIFTGLTQSGKTTAVDIAKTNGYDNQVFSLDCYYKKGINTPKNPLPYGFDDGYALDVDKLENDLLKLLRNQKMKTPTYYYKDVKTKKIIGIAPGSNERKKYKKTLQ